MEHCQTPVTHASHTQANTPLGYTSTREVTTEDQTMQRRWGHLEKVSEMKHEEEVFAIRDDDLPEVCLERDFSFKQFTEREVEVPFPERCVMDLLLEAGPQEVNLFSLLPTPVSFFESEQSIQDVENRPQILKGDESSQVKIPEGSKSRAYSKNATKNMGKLLLKYIWMNRRKLRGSVNASQEQWEEFIISVKHWRGLNGLTRQFLTQNWHASTSTARLFRTIACYFFRHRCRGSLYASRIQSKGQYLALMGRFLKATWDSRALDSLS